MLVAVVEVERCCILQARHHPYSFPYPFPFPFPYPYRSRADRLHYR